MTHEDACKILDIAFEADLDDARQVYRNLLSEYHPDKNPDADDRLIDELERKCQLIYDAWECLQKTIPERQARKEEERQRKAAEEARRKAEEERQRKAAQEARRKAEEERRKALAAVRKWVAVAAAVIGSGYIIADISGMFGDNSATITATAPSPRPRAFPTPPLTKEIERSAMPNHVKNQLMDKEEIALLPVVPTVSPSNLGLDDPSMPFPSMPLSNAPKTIEQSPSSLPRRSPADSPLEEKKPSLSADRPLTESEVRYCVFQKERLTHLRAMTTTLLFHRYFSHVHRKLLMNYRSFLKDYHARCVNTRYSLDPNIVKKVEAEAALNRAKLRSEADRIFVRWLNQP